MWPEGSWSSLFEVNKCIWMQIIESKPQGKSESTEFNLNDELMKYLSTVKKERIIVSELPNEANFIFIFSCFHNYEVSLCACIYACLDA